MTVEKSVNAFQGSSLLAAIKSILLESTWIAARWIKAAYANAEALAKTEETGLVHFWSRSRRTLWMKGETSGNTMRE